MIIKYIACGLGVILYGILAEEKRCKDSIEEIKRRGITKVFIKE